MWIVPAISIDCGFKIAVTLILFVRAMETRQKVIFWWAMGWLFFGLHAAVELIIHETSYEPLWFIRHSVYVFTALAFLESIGYMRHRVSKTWHLSIAAVGLGAVITSFLGVFVIKEWYIAVVPASFFNGMGFIVCAFYFFKFTKERRQLAQWLIFFGFLLNGIHNLDYPFLRPVAWFAPIGFSLGVVFSAIFAVGLIIMATEELKRQKEESQKRAEELSVLNSIAGVISQSLDLQKILNNVLDKVLEVLRIKSGGVLLLDKHARKLSLAAARGLSEEFIQKVKNVKLDKKTFIGKIAHTGKVMVSLDISEESTGLEAVFKKEGIRSFIGVPLKSKDKVLGIMGIVNHKSRLFNPEEIQLLTSIGSTVGVAIENIRLYEESSRLAIIDGVTEVFNHRYFYNRLNVELKRAERYSRPLSLIMLDIDTFKKYNDAYGHLEGDKALKKVADILKQDIRQVDMVSRYGGEEFTVLLPETDLTEAQKVAERMRAAIEDYKFGPKKDKLEVRLTISVGVAVYQSGFSAEELVKRADQVLYQAKREGKNKVCISV
jgi:diguanylate cyclase (GGDEF)-like protein